MIIPIAATIEMIFRSRVVSCPPINRPLLTSYLFCAKNMPFLQLDRKSMMLGGSIVILLFFTWIHNRCCHRAPFSSGFFSFQRKCELIQCCYVDNIKHNCLKYDIISVSFELINHAVSGGHVFKRWAYPLKTIFF